MKITSVNVQPTAETCHSQGSASNLINLWKSVIQLFCRLWSLLLWNHLLFLLFEIAKYFLLTEQQEENIETQGKTFLSSFPGNDAN